MGNTFRWGRKPPKITHWDRDRDIGTHTIASLSAQCRQVYCLVEMALSVPSGWVRRLPRPERRTKPNSPHNDCLTFFNIPSPQKKLQKNSIIRSIHKPAKPTISCSVSRKAKLEQNLHQPQKQPQLWIQRMTEHQNWYRIVHRNPQPNFAEK